MTKGPNWLFNDTPKRLKDSRKQEARTAKTLKTSLTIGSGNKNQKGDSQDLGLFGRRGRMVENKVTEKKQMSVKREWLEKLSKEALAAGKEPVFVFGFTETSFGSLDWGAVPLDRLQELYEAEERLKEYTGE